MTLILTLTLAYQADRAEGAERRVVRLVRVRARVRRVRLRVRVRSPPAALGS